MFFLKKIFPIIFILSCLMPLSSCQMDLRSLIEEYAPQQTEQSTEQTTEAVNKEDTDSSKAEEAQTEATPQKVFNQISISSDGTLDLMYNPRLANPDLEPPYSLTTRRFTHVKKCMVKIQRSQFMVTLERKKPQGSGTDSYYDYIYIVFEKGYNIPDHYKNIIKEYGIVYGFE